MSVVIVSADAHRDPRFALPVVVAKNKATHVYKVPKYTRGIDVQVLDQADRGTTQPVTLTDQTEC